MSSPSSRTGSRRELGTIAHAIARTTTNTANQLRSIKAISGVLVLALLASTPSPAAEGHTLFGKVTLRDESGGSASREVASIQLSFRPANAGFDTTKGPRHFEIATVNKVFSPRVLTVPVGSVVRFPNEDRIIHNVFSVSGVNRFDLGLYRQGEGKETTFEEPGVVRVFCNVHHSMVAYVNVVDTPFVTTPKTDGSFAFRDLPMGRGTLTAWHERGEPVSIDVEVPTSRPPAFELTVTKPRVPRHRNKFGKPYTRRSKRYR